MTAPDTQPGTCRSCRAPILWAVTANGKAMPLDPDPAADGNLAFRDDGRVCSAAGFPPGPRWKSHFATCPNAGKHRSRT